MSKISTNSTVVNDLTKQFSDSLVDLSFTPKNTISYCESPAVTELTSCLSSLTTSVTNFASYASNDIQKLTKIHETIKKAEESEMVK